MEDNDDWEEFDDEEEIQDSQSSTYKNYITPKGLQKIKGEYHQLFHVERPKFMVETIAWAASNGDRSENADYIYGKRRLREIDRRLRLLRKASRRSCGGRPRDQPNDKVLLGAKVTVKDEEGKKITYQIVGEDEIDIENRKISWVSPIAKAIMNAKVGDSVTVQRPNGEMELSVIKIEYAEEK